GLCNRCNWGLGNFRDDPDLLETAAKYLLHWDTHTAPKLDITATVEESPSAHHGSRYQDRYSQRWHIETAYGLTLEAYDAILDNPCRVCGRHKADHLDHDHATGKVRAGLCKHCNWGLGNFKDDADLLARAAEYLRHWRTQIELAKSTDICLLPETNI